MTIYSMKPPNIKAPKCTLFSRVKGHKGSPVLTRLLAGIVRGNLPRRAYFESLRAAEAKNAATLNQLKYRSRSCIMENIALGRGLGKIKHSAAPRALWDLDHAFVEYFP